MHTYIYIYIYQGHKSLKLCMFACFKCAHSFQTGSGQTFVYGRAANSGIGDISELVVETFLESATFQS